MSELKTCQDCGVEYRGGPLARYCQDCRKKHVGDSARRRRLCEIGAGARWHTKKDTGGPPEWIGPSAELKQEEANKSC